MVVMLTEIMPVQLRTSAFSVASSLATALFGGFTPAISTALIEYTGNRAVAGVWLSFAAACGLAAALMAGRERFAARQMAPAEERRSAPARFARPRAGGSGCGATPGARPRADKPRAPE